MGFKIKRVSFVHKKFAIIIICIPIITPNTMYYRMAMSLRGHTAELSNCIWNFDCSMIATSSLDTSARVWDLRNFNCMHTITGHRDEILDICFDYTGKRLATASSDCTAKIWDVSSSFDLLAIMSGHNDELSKVIYIKYISYCCFSLAIHIYDFEISISLWVIYI